MTGVFIQCAGMDRVRDGQSTTAAQDGGFDACPSCGSTDLTAFHHQEAVPANSCLLLESAEEATTFPLGSLRLALCEACGLISNVDFDPELAEYSQRYEETQGFSPRFQEFAAALAKGWVERYDLRGKQVLEIGCGKGEFLTLMAHAGIGWGIGIDPSFRHDRVESPPSNLAWLERHFTRDDDDLVGDAVVCRHTLEHIGPVGRFVADLRAAIGDRTNTVALFELPDSMRILEEVAFWDVYYEHAAYFTEGSLTRLFERHGFEVLDLRREYDDQYLILEARPADGGVAAPWPVDDLDAVRARVARFRDGYVAAAETWRGRLAEESAAGGRSVIWGASSKGVSFLGLVGEHVAAAVDINPHKRGTFVAGTGHRVVGPEDLGEIDPTLVVVMNPIYVDEIRAQLENLGLTPQLLAV